MAILHFCPVAVWREAQAAGRYAADTLTTEGFIHCSTAGQVHLPANARYPGRTDLVLLEIDESRLDEPPRYEPGDPADPGSMRFPHVYGPIPLDAVVAVHEFRPGPDGLFRAPPALAGQPAPPALAGQPAPPALAGQPAPPADRPAPAPRA
jgi:uncharacterized protein (DUF952 family)